MELKFTCISDTHQKHNLLPEITEKELLIHCGDSNCGSYNSSIKFLDWFSSQKAKYKILIAGNHDWAAYKNPTWFKDECKLRDIIYLCNEGVEINGFKIWGSPYTPEFCGWAFMMEDNDLNTIWRQIPYETDLLITHGPMYNMLDICRDGNVGSKSLQKNIIKIKPKYHVFGHIHGSNGTTKTKYTTFINCSVLDDSYNLNNKPFQTGELKRA